MSDLTVVSEELLLSLQQSYVDYFLLRFHERFNITFTDMHRIFQLFHPEFIIKSLGKHRNVSFGLLVTVASSLSHEKNSGDLSDY